TQVVVAEGRVALGGASGVKSGPADSVEIGAGELARMNANGAITTIRLASVDSYFAWTEGRLVFDRVPLGVVLDELSRWYDVDFVLADASLAHVRLTTVLRGETLGEALEVLETSLAI